MAYDVALEPDGEWTPQELAKFRVLYHAEDADGAPYIRLQYSLHMWCGLPTFGQPSTLATFSGGAGGGPRPGK